ncbi:MAG TPA: RHS repeat-associated core domain-containing protein [Cyclobacteriaceae bacterium]|nr:RHS repeat-associated core domain-containing protein [Cyclobacteriaceae bacterium]
MNGTPNEQHGLARSLSVMPGDTLDIEVRGKYVDVANANPSLQAFLASIASGTAAAGTIVDGSNYGTAAGNAFPFDDTFLDKQDDHDAGPKAFLNFLVFDRDYNHIDAKCGYKQLPNDAGEDGTGKDFKPMNQRIIIDKPGYVYIYLSNDNVVLGGGPVEVYFDDFTVTQIKSPIIQQNDYYPYGAVAQSFSREGSLENKRLYQGKEYQSDLGLNLYNFHWRQYDPWAPHTTTMDPHAERYYSLSPYSWAGGNPMHYVDPDGRDITVFYTDYKRDKEGNIKYRKNGEAKTKTYSVSLSIGKSGSVEAKDKKGNDVHDSFVSSVVSSLNYVKKGDQNNVVTNAINHRKTLKVREGEVGDDHFNPSNNTIKWHPQSAMQVLDNNGNYMGTQSSALGLFHEVGHGYNKISDPRAFFRRSNTPVAGYDDQEEQHVITNYETPAAIKLGETPRTNHNGDLLYSTGATSTTEMFPDVYKTNPDGN